MPNLSERPIDSTRLEVSKQLDPSRRSKLGQFMTPIAIADFMASLFTRWPKNTRLLDPGSGIGSLTEAFAERFLAHAPVGASLEAHCYEIEPVLISYLSDHLREIDDRLGGHALRFSSTVHERDYIAEASFQISLGCPRFTHAILNPPYKKINTGSEHRKLLRIAGIETVNLYTAFLGLTLQMMEEAGEIVAIIPRSFCNGLYYRPFREFVLKRACLTHIHMFESRSRAFRDDEVLQENIIIRLVRGGVQGNVCISTSHDPSFSDFRTREIRYSDVVKPDDPERFIHIPTEEVSGTSLLFTHSLKDLKLEVSTGPVVDFRVRKHWLAEPIGECAPLLYTHHFKGGVFSWPKSHKKPNALILNDETQKWLLPRGCYTITKRFSAKEERRRLVAFVVEPDLLPHGQYGFENHLNVFHERKAGLPSDLARGLAVFLNSTIVDKCFRSFSGHTQVNATDLRAMRYPSRSILNAFGEWAMKQERLSQEIIDQFVQEHDGR